MTADFRALVNIDLLRQKLYDEVTKDTPATEEQVRVRHILIRTIEAQPTPTPGPTAAPGSTPEPTPAPTEEPRSAEQALALAIAAKQRLDAGEDFATVAQELSDDRGSAGTAASWVGSGRNDGEGSSRMRLLRLRWVRSATR
jgi:parvulin-like peptidyl-prolyl isomerase